MDLKSFWLTLLASEDAHAHACAHKPLPCACCHASQRQSMLNICTDAHTQINMNTQPNTVNAECAQREAKGSQKAEMQAMETKAAWVEHRVGRREGEVTSSSSIQHPASSSFPAALALAPASRCCCFSLPSSHPLLTSSSSPHPHFSSSAWKPPSSRPASQPWTGSSTQQLGL